MIRLKYERFIQKQVGTGLRPEWQSKATRPAVVASGKAIRVYERDPSQPVHFSIEHDYCHACGVYQAKPWTDDPELYNRHPARCNFAFVATEVE